MKTKIIRAIIRWLWRYLCVNYFSDLDAVIKEDGVHIHKNPVKKPKVTAVVDFPQPGGAELDQ